MKRYTAVILGLLAAAPAPLLHSTSLAAPASRAPRKPVAARKPPAGPPSVRFLPAALDLAPGETYPLEIFFPNPKRKAFQAAPQITASEGLTLIPDTRAGGAIPRYGLKLYPKVTARPDATGPQQIEASLEGVRGASLPVRIVEPEIRPAPGYQVLAVRITNRFRARPLSGRILASNPNRFLENVTAREFRIPAGEMGEVVFPLPGAAPAQDETYEFSLELQTYQGYRRVYKYDLEFPPLKPGFPAIGEAP